MGPRDPLIRILPPTDDFDVSHRPGGYSFNVGLADEAGTYRLMADIAAALEPGDLVTLSGDLGAGKTTFARALIRHSPATRRIEVPSPTFTLMQTYELPRFPVVHADLYRLRARASSPSSASTMCPRTPWCCWNGRTAPPAFLPPDRLDIAFTLAPQHGAEHRNARVTGYGTLRGARRAHRRDPPLSRSHPASPRPSAGASRATPRRAPTSG